MVVELKTGKFQPEYAGKLQFYIALVDDKLRRPAHSPTLGILICGSRNEHTVSYALNQSKTPMAVSTYTYETLPPRSNKPCPTPSKSSPPWSGHNRQNNRHYVPRIRTRDGGGAPARAG